jgi:hypothetical protein
MKVVNIKINQIPSLKVISVNIKQKVNEHSFLELKGYIDEGTQDNTMAIAYSDEEIQVKAIGEESECECLFNGDVYSLNLEFAEHKILLDLVLVSTSKKLDGLEKTRTFQNGGMQYSELMEYVSSEYGANLLMKVADKSLGNLITQYKETDWQFIKRLASNLNACIIPVTNMPGIKYYVGFNSAQPVLKPDIETLSMQNQLGELRMKKSKGLSMQSEDALYYNFESREVYPLGGKVEVKGSVYGIYEIHSYYKKSELVHKYSVKLPSGFVKPVSYNDKEIGASLPGSITAVSGTTVKIKLDVDSSNGVCGSRDFMYSTVYSSPDGTGWYCMPEIGDRIRLYYPTEFEKDAYVISSVHLEVSNEPVSQQTAGFMPPRSNPSYKSISNKDKKEIVFGPDGLVITNNAGMLISLNDENGINIVSNQPIYMHSDEMIEFNAGNSIYFNANEEILIEQGESLGEGEAAANNISSVDMKSGIITFKGSQMRLQEKM